MDRMAGMVMRRLAPVGLACFLCLPGPAPAGEADVLAVDLIETGQRVYTFNVTVQHADEGWDHYADSWEVLAPDGRVLATRVLLHPHVGEQPFTRSLTGVEIPTGIEAVEVRAHDSVHELGGITLTVEIPAP
jgi:hypothetical protein